MIVSGGGVINADASKLLVEFAELRRAGDSDADVLGRDPRRPSADGRHGRPADVPPLRQRDDARLRLRARRRQPLGEPSHRIVDVYTKGRKFVHVDIEPTQIGRVFGPDLGIVSDAKAALELFVEVAREWKAQAAEGPQPMGQRMPRAQEDDAAPDALRGKCRSSRSASTKR